MNIPNFLREPWPRILGIPLLAFLLTFAYNSNPDFPGDYLLTLVFTAVMWQGDYMIIMFFRKRFPELSITHKRLLLTVSCILIYNVSADYGLCQFFRSIGVTDMTYWDDSFLPVVGKNLAATCMVGTIYEAGYFFRMWQHQTVEVEQIKSQQLRSELSVLKNQISPHFLFNSLNTLVSLIHENPKQAAHFTEKLSEVYRYILQCKDKEIVKLSTELRFTQAYNYLMKIRFEDSFIVHLNIADEYLDCYVAPLTLQMLIENAVKHNIVSASRPLVVDIYIENGKSLIVRNNLQSRNSQGESLKTGLHNIRQRYAYLSEREVDVIETRQHFMVALPLIYLSKTAEEISEW